MDPVDQLMHRMRVRLLVAGDPYYTHFRLNKTRYREIAAGMLPKVARSRPVGDRIIEDFWGLPQEARRGGWTAWLKKYIATRLEGTQPEYIKSIKHRVFYRISGMDVNGVGFFPAFDVSFNIREGKSPVLRTTGDPGALSRVKSAAKNLLTGKKPVNRWDWQVSSDLQDWFEGKAVEGIEVGPDDIGPDDIKSITIEGPYVFVSWTRWEQTADGTTVLVGPGVAILRGGPVTLGSGRAGDYYSPDQDGWRVYAPKFDGDPAIYTSADSDEY
jgi:hypothetical protein